MGILQLVFVEEIAKLNRKWARERAKAREIEISYYIYILYTRIYYNKIKKEEELLSIILKKKKKKRYCNLYVHAFITANY